MAVHVRHPFDDDKGGIISWPPGTTDHTREAFKTLVSAAIEKPGVLTMVSDPHKVALVADVSDQYDLDAAERAAGKQGQMTRTNLFILIGGAWAAVIEKRDDEGRPPAFDTFVPPPKGYEIISNAVVPLVQAALAELAAEGRLV